MHLLRADPLNGLAAIGQVLFSKGESSPLNIAFGCLNLSSKVGVTASAVITIIGLLGFVFLQLSDDTAAYDTEANPPCE